MNSKIIGVLLIAGFGCLVFAAIAPMVIDQYTVENTTHAAILDESENSVNKSAIRTVHLERNQKLTIKLFVYVNETSATEDILHLIILSWLNYNASQNADPGSIGTTPLVTFQADTYTYPPTADLDLTDETNLALTAGTFYIIELTGYVPTTDKPIPGDFYIIIYNEDTSTPDGSTLYYDISIQLDQLGTTLSPWFVIIGLALVAMGAVLGVIYLGKR